MNQIAMQVDVNPSEVQRENRLLREENAALRRVLTGAV